MVNKDNTSSQRKTAIIVGALFIIATAASILGSIVILGPVLDSAAYLTAVAENETQVILGVLIDAINSLAVIGIAALLYPILKKYHENTAVGYVGFRILESAILIVGSITLLALVSLSQEHVQAGVADTPYYQTLGDLLLAVSDWAQMLGAMVVFSLTALILNVSLYQSKLVPRFISIWGLIGAILMLAAGLLAMLGLGYLSPITVLLGLPLALNEMVLAVWLIAKGFDPSAIATGNAK